MPTKKPTKKALRPAKVEKKAPQNLPKKESLENRVVEIGKHVETLIKQREPVSLVDAQREVLEKLPQMIGDLSGQLEQIGKREILKKLPQLVHKSLSEQVGQKMQEAAKVQDSRLANLENMALGKLEAIEKQRSEFQKAQVVKWSTEGKEFRSEIQSLRKEVQALKQDVEGKFSRLEGLLEEMKSIFDQVVSKLSPPAHEEQPKQAEEPKVG